MNRAGITLRFVALLFFALCLSLVCMALLRVGVWIAALLYGLAVLAALLDFLLTPGTRWFETTRQLPTSFEQRKDSDVLVTVHSKGPCGIRLRLSDSPPKTFRSDGKAQDLFLESDCATCSYPVTPTRRGVFAFGKCYLEVHGRWGLASKRFSMECKGEAEGSVYPNLSAMRHYRMLAEHRQLSREDSSLHKVRGIGSEFAGIREYAPDDDWRKVNWKATARAGKLMTNIYDVEKNRDVILAVDTGRWMQASNGEVTKLDRALEMAAALMQVALSSGDKVGLLMYHMDVVLYLPPDKGPRQSAKILSSLYSAQATQWPTSTAALSNMLRRKLTKRAFVCVLTYFDSTEEAAVALSELAPILRRHSVLFSSLADEGLDELAAKEASEPFDVYLKAAAVHRKQSVLAAAELLNKSGVGAYAAEPSELLTRSVRHYLSVKGRPQ
ncbi:MAG: DUF58 domain-containing protein [Clostridiales bacterium]|nr:DUF58 domain-containing protein [Clostridiales bacterium]